MPDPEDVRRGYDELKTQVKNYIGYILELEHAREKQLPGPDQVFEQPEALRLRWICKSMNSMWEAGGVGDQPHILMNEFLICDQAEGEFTEERKKLSNELAALTQNTSSI